ncbi:DUF2778 domain-containing protein [Methylobacterium sp. R2-1]|uniref:DUF2778 domain-containing protein n=1 Tax=Methylobacterium sp. R2-1 TaxID=2587064 RepID=UPI00160F9F13|nr:DUF2778 domain-containing protein [Methylobacterium sp. R2-1]MBB2962770.1 hypothetical protein [Methylobacterium sp. R2-1]
MDIAELVQSRSARPVVRRRRRPPLAALALTALGGLALAGMLQPQDTDALSPAETAQVSAETEQADTAPAAPGALAWMLDPAPVLDTATSGFVQQAPKVAAFRSPAVPEPSATLAALPAAQVADAAPAVTPRPAAPMARVALTVPLPMRRPEEFRYEPRTQTARAASARVAATATARASTEPTRSVFSAAVTDNRNFLEKMFDLPGSGTAPSSAPAMAYAGLDSSAVDSAARRRLVPGPVSEPGVAVYDISAATVTLPSGEVLEAHSGLGVAQDNPDYVHVRMRGATPPGVYDLREREALFHGVRAIRLNPVGGSAAIHGRDGILAHTYMLGPSGASNGCVVFKNYPRFLQAYLRGEVRRLVVVPGTAPGVFASRRNATPRRSASAD